MAAPKKRAFVAVVGITLEDGTRIEPGEPFPGEPADWLVEQRLVEEA